MAAKAAVAEVAAAAAVVVVAAVVVLLVVEESLGMILCLKKVRFSHLLKRRDGRTDRPSYRDARTHQKTGKKRIIRFFWTT